MANWVLENFKRLAGINEEELVEMANLRPSEVGVGVKYYIWTAPNPKKQGYRIKVVNEPGRIDHTDSISISISDNPKVVAGKSKVPADQLNKIFKFVQLNKDLLIRHANMEIDDHEMKANLRRV